MQIFTINKIALGVCIGCLTFISCTKEKVDTDYSGKANASLNGYHWEAKVRAVTLPSYPGKIFMNFDVFNEDGYLRQSLTLNNVSPLIDSTFLIENPVFDSSHVIINLNPYSHFQKFVDHGDLVSDVYDVLETSNRWLVIDSYDSNSKQISGHFELSVVRDTSWSGLPRDTLKFLNGSFYATVTN